MIITRIALIRLESDLPRQNSTVEKLSLVRLFLCAILALSIGGLPAVSALSSDWHPTSSLPISRFAAGAAVLPSGRVLVVGGDSFVNARFNPSAEIYDPVTESWTVTTPLPNSHRFIALLLKTGEVLVVGDDAAGTVIPTGYIYNESAATWTPTGPPSIRRFSSTVTLLPSGKVLMAGGYNGGCCNGRKATYKSAEIYNRKSNLWSSTSSMTERRLLHTATLLPSGKVLVVGGAIRDPVTPHSSAEIYNYKKNIWSLAGSMTTSRFAHTATLLPNGKVLVAGGFKGRCTSVASAEIYDPATDTWMSVAPMRTARGRHAAVLLNSGKVLIVGGQSDNCTNSSMDSAELYDPVSGTWSEAGTLTDKRSQHMAVLLSSNRVLVAGGIGTTGLDISSAEVYVAAQATTITSSNGK